MQELVFLSKAAKKAGLHRFFDTLNAVQARSGKGKPYLLWDMLWCGLLYGAGHTDYKLYGFENLNRKQRKTFLTRGYNNRLVRLLNDSRYLPYFDDKSAFHKAFAKYIHRQCLDLRRASLEEFSAFLSGKEEIIAKPVNGCCGQGVQKIRQSEWQTEDLYDHLKEQRLYTVEEVIPQQKKMASLCPSSVNTIRIVTVLTGSRPHAVYARLRIGSGKSIVDNLNAGGMCAPVDIKRGKVTLPACDKQGNTYEAHPVTGEVIVGFSIPMWQQCISICLHAARELPQVGYVGWDVCLAEEGPLLIEGNCYPGHDLIQLPPHVPDKTGMLPVFRTLVPEL